MKNKKKKKLDTYIKLLGEIYNLTHKKKATHAFYFSKEQSRVGNSCFGSRDRTNPRFEGNKYSEMRAFEYGWSNWNDAKLLGVGCYGDAYFN